MGSSEVILEWPSKVKARPEGPPGPLEEQNYRFFPIPSRRPTDHSAVGAGW